MTHRPQLTLRRKKHQGATYRARTLGRAIVVFSIASCLLHSTSQLGRATPTTQFWTLASADVQGYMVWHVGVDNYFTVNKDGADGSGSFPTDVGLTVGILPYQKFNMEVGIDYIEPTDSPVSLSFKFGTPEGSLAPGAPGLAAGVFGLGFDDGVTDLNTFYFVACKSIPRLGRIHGGGYAGNSDTLLNAAGEPENKGFLIGWDRYIIGTSVAIAADYASGRNILGGGGIGFAIYFTPDVSLLTGPVWFNEEGINGSWKWSVQLDVNIRSRK